MITFPPFRLDRLNQCLWRCRDTGDDERILLPPKTFAVLRYLVEHAGRLISEAELLEAVWPRAYVQPEVIKSQLYEIRKALGDNPKAPRYIETFPRRGYRFIAQARQTSSTEVHGAARATCGRLVGRDRPLGELRDYLGAAVKGRRQIVFVTGEPGIGATAVVDELQRQAIIAVPSLRVARGQCIEGYGGKEAYYPMLEALSQLCRGPDGASIVDSLAMQAPTWLVQFPALLRREHRELLQQEIRGATRERMLREIGAALETIAAETPLLLVFEDLQWVDPSTVDLLSALARSRAQSNLMLIGTIRPVDMMPAGHPLKSLKQELLVHQLCHEVALEPLSEADVAEYLAGSPQTGAPPGLAELLHRHSGGNPLYMVAALDHLRERGFIWRENGSWQLKVPLQQIDLGVPESLRQMIEAQIERLSAEEQQALEAASMVGAAFCATLAAAAVDSDAEALEDLYETLARRRRTVRPAGTRRFLNGSSPEYEFVHALYREVLYQRQAPGRRARSQRRIEERLRALRLQIADEASPKRSATIGPLVASLAV